MSGKNKECVAKLLFFGGGGVDGKGAWRKDIARIFATHYTGTSML